MKSISASIIVLSGGALLLGGATYISHNDTKTFFVMAAGVVVMFVGLIGWLFSLKQDKEP